MAATQRLTSRSLFGKYWNMIWGLSWNTFKMRDQGTFFGFLWTLAQPLIYFLVMYNLFVKWMGAKIDDFPLYLIIGIVQWNFFASGTSASINSILGYGTFVRNVNFPRAVLVITSVFSVLLSHLVELFILLVFWLIVKGHIGITAVCLLPLMVLNVYLVLSISFVLATVGVYFLDIARIWGILMSVGMFITPIFYSLDMLSPHRRLMILLNPMTHIIQATRQALIENRWPDLGGLLYVFVFSTVVLICGYTYFKNKEGYFVEHI